MEGYAGTCFGVKFIEDDLMYVTTSEPMRKHKRHRIQKKWIRRFGYRYFKEPLPKIIQLRDQTSGGSVFVGHSETLRRFKRSIEQGRS